MSVRLTRFENWMKRHTLLGEFFGRVISTFAQKRAKPLYFAKHIRVVYIFFLTQLKFSVCVFGVVSVFAVVLH